MPSKRVGESDEEYRERNKKYCQDYKANNDYTYKYKNSSPEIRDKERERNRIRAKKNYNESRKFDALHLFCEKIRRRTFLLFPHNFVGVCPDCFETKELETHHFVYTYPILKEHIGYKCRRCHKKWHKNNEPIIIVVDIPIEQGNCIICDAIFDKDPPNKITCCDDCRKVNALNLQRIWRLENARV